MEDRVTRIGNSAVRPSAKWTVCVDCGKPLDGNEPVPVCKECSQRNMELAARQFRDKHRPAEEHRE
jgi:hypothetical protein